MNDLEHETQLYMFNSYVLKVDPTKLDHAGYHCLRNFFETINLVERKLRKGGSAYQALVRAGGRGMCGVCHVVKVGCFFGGCGLIYELCLREVPWRKLEGGGVAVVKEGCGM